MHIYLAGPSAGNIQPLFKNTQATMDIYLAGLSSDHKRANATNLFAQRLYILESFYYTADWMDAYIKSHWHFMLDSGAFTFMRNPKEKVNWEAYVDKYADYINHRDIKLFFELDIDNVVGLDKVELLRKRLEHRTGKQSIPVWHHKRGRNYWEMMCKEYPYVALGGMVSDMKYRKAIEPMFPFFIDSAHASGAKIHALGYTSIDGLHRYRFDSVDSTSWVSGNIAGKVYRFNGRGMDAVKAPNGKGIKSLQTAVHNFGEWVKFQQYAKQHL